MKNDEVETVHDTLADIHIKSCAGLTTEKGGGEMRREKQQRGAFMDILYTYRYPCQ